MQLVFVGNTLGLSGRHAAHGPFCARDHPISGQKMDMGSVVGFVEQTLSSWHGAKLFLERSVGFSQDAVHVIAGVLVQLFAALLLRKAISSWWPWLAVLGATILNEAIDLGAETWPNAAMQYGESFKDILLTMLLPTALLVTSRWTPQLYSGRGLRRGRRRG